MDEISNFEKLIKIAGFTKPQNIKINLFFFFNTPKFLLNSPCLQYEKLPSMPVGWWETVSWVGWGLS